MPSNTQKLEQILKTVSESADISEKIKSQLLDFVDQNVATHARIESATKLSKSQEVQIKMSVSATSYTFSTNSDLIAGLKITLGDRVSDYSITAKLSAITSQL